MEEGKSRNREIYEAYLSGVKLSELSREYGVSHSRIQQLVKKEKKKDDREKESLYLIMKELCDDEVLLVRTITVFERNGIYTEEELMQLDKKAVSKLRNCGIKMTEFIMEVQEEIKKKSVS